MKSHNLKDQQQINRSLLRSVIQKKIDENQPLSLKNNYSEICGTIGCILGDYCLLKNPEIINLEYPADRVDAIEEWCNKIYKNTSGDVNEFGSPLSYTVFNGLSLDSWQDRLDTLNQLEAELVTP